MFSGQFQVGLKKIQELLLLFDFEPSILLEIDNDAIGNRPLAAGSENLAFREHYEIVPKEKLEVVNDNLLDLFFSIELGKISSKYLPFFVQFRHFSSKFRLNYSLFPSSQSFYLQLALICLKSVILTYFH